MIAERTALPAQIGLSSARLRVVDSVIQSYIDRGVIAGAVTLAGRTEQVGHLGAYGHMDLESARAMRPDAIFRLASMTKPVVAVAVLMLFEEGKLLLNDAVSKYIPAFNNLQVAVANPTLPAYVAANVPSGVYHLVPAERAITIRDLLTHTSGLGSATVGLAFEQATALLKELKPTDTLADAVPKMASVPLSFQPGSMWEYSGAFGFDTLGHIVEVISGRTLWEFFSERIFEPLGIRDTFFHVPPERLSEVPVVYERGPNGLQPGAPSGILSFSTAPGACYMSGGGGLAGTAEDYARFALMLASGGRPLLSRHTVALMASNHIGQLAYAPMGPDLRGYRFGLGVRVLDDPAEGSTLASRGTFGWAGAFGTNSWVDPVERLVGLLLIQRMFANPPDQELRTLWPKFQTAIYQALDE